MKRCDPVTCVSSVLKMSTSKDRVTAWSQQRHSVCSTGFVDAHHTGDCDDVTVPVCKKLVTPVCLLPNTACV